MIKLESLTLEALRGATKSFELKFEKNKPICIIYGENGSGKSTVCDALDILANGVLGSLLNKGLSSTTRYWHSTNRDPTDVQIKLASSSETWTAQIVRGKVVTNPPDSRPRVAILRRHQIWDLLAKPPGAKYEALRPFIAIEAIDNSETTLRKLLNSTKKELEIAVARVGENLIALEDLYKQAASTDASVLDWARAEAQRDPEEQDKSISVIQNVTRLQQSVESRLSDLEGATFKLAAQRKSLDTAEQELGSAIENASSSSEELTRLFQAAHEYFQVHSQPQECPLCESREFARTLPSAVEKRLQGWSAVRTALNKKIDTQRSFEASSSQLQTATRYALEAARSLVRILLTDWPADLPLAGDLPERARVVKEAEEGGEWDLSVLKLISEAGSRLVQLLEPELAIRIKRRTQLQTVKNLLEQYRHNLQQQTELSALVPRLEKTHEILMEERRLFVDEILNRIAQRVGELYEEVHPGEGLNKISLELDPEKRASLDVLSQFPGANDCPPGAYLSESHLDTLGVCIFLALAELDEPEQAILVLDDVIASVDEPHVDRMVELLYTISKKFAHCVLTTHYTPWKEKYRWGFLKNGECQFIELGKWSFDEGIVGFGTKLRIERLREQLSVPLPEVSEVCATAGVVLEAVLDFLTLRFNCAVPRRLTKPTLGDLLPPIKAKLRKALRVEVYDKAGVLTEEIQLGPILDKLDKLVQVRNVMGAHFNRLAFELPDKDGLNFSQLVLELADAIVDAEYGWPASDRSGAYWTNSGKSRRLYPLMSPA
jgi:energy-coupling factor transporter ATP-binding protein EcfA2